MKQIALHRLFSPDQSPEKEQHGGQQLERAPPRAAYEDAEVPGKGIGLVATILISANMRVMTRTPAFVVDQEALQGLDEKSAARLVHEAVAQLPASHRDRFMNLSTHDDLEAGGEALRAWRIFSINRFRTGLGSIVDGEFHAAFTEVSRMNHDCRPNAAYFFDPTSLSHKVSAIRDISPGEEITISYIDGFQPAARRQELLETHWGFTCTCNHCTLPPEQRAAADDRIAHIKHLWAELDDYSATSSASPQKAERLIALYRQEGMHGRIQEAHYRAALEWNGVGEAARAVEHARLCIRKGLLFNGPGKPFIESMERLIADPESHHTWRFRVAAP